MGMKWIYAIQRDLKLPDFPNFVFFFLGVKLTTVAKPQIPNDIPSYTMYES